MDRLRNLVASSAVIGIFLLGAAPVLATEQTHEAAKFDGELQYLGSLLEKFEGLRHQVATMSADTTPDEVKRVSILLQQTLQELNELYGDTGRDMLAEKLLKQQTQTEKH